MRGPTQSQRSQVGSNPKHESTRAIRRDTHHTHTATHYLMNMEEDCHNAYHHHHMGVDASGSTFLSFRQHRTSTTSYQHFRLGNLHTDPFIPKSGPPYPPNACACACACGALWSSGDWSRSSQSNLQSIFKFRSRRRDYGPLSSTEEMAAEFTTEDMLWVSALCANLNRQSLLTLWSNDLSTPPLVKPSASMFRVSTQCIF